MDGNRAEKRGMEGQRGRWGGEWEGGTERERENEGRGLIEKGFFETIGGNFGKQLASVCVCASFLFL